MKRATLICIASITLGAALSGCQWVKLTPSGEKARVLTATQVNDCKKVGITTVSVKATVAGVGRSESKVFDELQALARNASEGLGGDTVVPASKVSNGSQVFDVYKCLGIKAPAPQLEETN